MDDTELPFSENDGNCFAVGNEKRLNGSRMTQIEDKSNQFFGATVSASRKHDKLMVRQLITSNIKSS